MRNLWIFISKYNAFFFFIIFFVASIILLINNNSFQRASFLNSSNEFIGRSYEQISNLRSYLNLRHVNDSLAAENARLRNSLKSSFFDDSLVRKTITDTASKQQYTYIVARVINNSIHQKNNYITINRGKRHGIEKGMGVISLSGVVGIVINVSDHFATIRSLLHSGTKISASISGSGTLGSLVWGEEENNSQIATLKDIPTHVIVKKGQQVVTSNYSLFPQDLPIGRIIGPGSKRGESFLNLKVKLYTDFSTLKYVYVVQNKLALEQKQLEDQSRTNEPGYTK